MSTNRTSEGRVYVLLMDSPSTVSRGGGIHRTRLFARQFIEDVIAPGDVAAVAHVMGTFSDSQSFTTSRDLLVNAVDKFRLGLADAGMMGAERAAHNLATYRAIEEISERLGRMSGRRKAIVWIGGGIAFDPTINLFACRNHPGTDECATGRSAANLLAGYRDAIGAATRNNVAIHVIDPVGLSTVLGESELHRTAALRMVAEDTGGVAVVSTNNIAPLYQAIMRDASTYYVLGYSPQVEHRDGRFHRVQVRVKRPELTIRARGGYYAPRPDAGAPVLPPLPEGVSEAARGALLMPTSVRGLSIDLFAAPFRGAGEQASIVVGGQVTGDLRLHAGDRVALAFQVFTLEGKVHTGEYKVFTLDLLPDTRAIVEESGVRFVDRIALPPGRYELRFVVDQPGGSVGSVVTPLDVPDFDDRLVLSGVLLAASGTADHLTLREDEELRERLGSDPTAIRRFTRADLLTAFAEVYSSDARLTEEDVTVSAGSQSQVVRR